MFEKEFNPSNITEADVAVVIPSFNEADNIQFPAKMASEGLRKYFPDMKGVIINADANSPDGTVETFLATETETPKIAIVTSPLVTGKGWSFANAWRRAISMGVKVIVCIDADLLSVTPEWMYYMISPILEGTDYLTPLYSRHKYDGTITNNITYPLIYGIMCRNIRQPIGGDFALSARLANYLLTRPWHRTTHEYGIDIFMTMNAVLGGFKTGECGLGAKIHKPSAPKLGPMFIQVVGTAFLTIANNFEVWSKLNAIKNQPLFGLRHLDPAQDLEVDRAKICANSKKEFESAVDELRKIATPDVMKRLEKTYGDKDGPKINTDFWVDILFDMIAAFPTHEEPSVLVESMRGLWFGRVFSFMNDTWDLTSAECEEPIRAQGERVFERRQELVKRLAKVYG